MIGSINNSSQKNIKKENDRELLLKINKQLEKTLDPNRIKKWKGREWQIKVDGFRHLFKRNEEFLQNKKNSICLGARTGQEVFVLRELGLDSIGIDLVEFPPYTIKGDIHNLFYEDGIFDLVFTNILDHSLYLQKFISEMERVSTKGGIIILNIHNRISDFSQFQNISSFLVNFLFICLLCQLTNT